LGVKIGHLFLWHHIQGLFFSVFLNKSFVKFSPKKENLVDFTLEKKFQKFPNFLVKKKNNDSIAHSIFFFNSPAFHNSLDNRP
jgi:hypothetical protein